MINIDIEEPVLSIDEFNKPLVMKGKDAIFILLVRLLLLKPGTFQTHPEMGVGIVSRYRYGDDDVLNNLEKDIENQISTYIPQVSGAQVQLSSTLDKELNIQISIGDSLYIFKTDSENDTLISISSLEQ